MLRDTPCEHQWTLWVDGFLVEFLLEREGIQVSISSVRWMGITESSSWETMVPSRTLDASAVKAIFLLLSSPLFLRRTPPRGNKK